MKKGRLVFVSTFLMVVAALVAACGTPSNPPPTPNNSTYKYVTPTHKGGTLLISDWQFPDSTNPLFATTVVDVTVDSGLWGAPITVTSDAKVVADELTEIPSQANGDVSKDGLTVTMKLRHDLKWSDGQAITSADFLYMLKTVNDPATGAASTQGFDPGTIASYTAPDNYTVVLQYKQVFASFLFFLPYPLPQHAWGSIPNAQLQNKQEVNLTPNVTSGPYMVSDYASQQSFTLVPNTHYVSTTLHPAVLDKLIFKGYSAKDALIAGYRASETDYATDFTVGDLAKVNGLPGLSITPAIESEHLDFNQQTPVLQDVNVRKAIAQAIDRCSIIQNVLHQTCSKLYTDNITPSPSPLFNASLKGYTFDASAAKADLQTSGWDCSKAPTSPCTKGGAAFPNLRLSTTKGNQVRADEMALIQKNLADVGIPVTTSVYPGGAFFGPYSAQGVLATGQYDLAIFAYSYPLDFYGALGYFQSTQIPTATNQAGGNYERVNDPTIDNYINTGNQTLDFNKRADIFKQMLQYVSQQMYELPLYERPNINLVDNRFGNFFPNPTSFGNTWNAGDYYAKS